MQILNDAGIETGKKNNFYTKLGLIKKIGV
jgi:hypothetical protein